MKGRVFILFIVAVSLLFLPVAGMAQGKVTVKPTVTTSWKTDSNFFKSEINKREVYTYLLQPGIQLGYDTGKSKIDLKYTLDAWYYDDQDTLQAGWLPADDEDYVGHTGRLDLQTKATEKVTLGIETSYQRTRDPADADPLSNSIAREKYDLSKVAPRLTYAFGPKLMAKMQYRFTDTDYDLVTEEDDSEKRPVFNLIYSLDSTTSLDLDYQYWEKDYDLNTSDYDANHIKLVLNKKYKYLSFNASAGYHDMDFEDVAEKDLDEFTYSLGFTWQNAPSGGAAPTSRFSLSLGQDLSDSKFKGRTYNLNARHLITARLPLGLKAGFKENDYESTFGLTPDGIRVLKHDESYNVEGSIGYILNDEFTFTTSAGYESMDSNLVGEDYNNRFIMARLDFMYNVGRN